VLCSPSISLVPISRSTRCRTYCETCETWLECTMIFNKQLSISYRSTYAKRMGYPNTMPRLRSTKDKWSSNRFGAAAANKTSEWKKYIHKYIYIYYVIYIILYAHNTSLQFSFANIKFSFFLSFYLSSFFPLSQIWFFQPAQESKINFLPWMLCACTKKTCPIYKCLKHSQACASTYNANKKCTVIFFCMYFAYIPTNEKSIDKIIIFHSGR
jgi:hypothetical protein